MDGWRIKLVLFGGLLASGGIVVLVKDIQHQRNGIAASANVRELKSECYVSRLQVAENRWDRETIDCETEPELKRAFGSDKHVQVIRQDTATIEFPLQNGTSFTTEVGQQPYTRSGPLHVGDHVPVVYDPKVPRDARAPLGVLDVCVSLAIFAFGATGVLFGLKFNVKRTSDADIKLKAASASPAPTTVRTSVVQPVRPSRVALATGGSSRAAQSSFGRR